MTSEGLGYMLMVIMMCAGILLTFGKIVVFPSAVLNL
jgi:hypothetical protein